MKGKKWAECPKEKRQVVAVEEFMALYEEVYKDLYKVAYYYMGNKDDAEDAVGDGVLKAYEHFGSLRDKASFRGWIIRIVVNCCKRKMKARYRREEKLEEEGLFHEPDYVTGPAVQTAMETLSEEERLIVSLYVLGGYRGEEISRLLHKNHNTVRSKYHRALDKLRKQLEG